jgi:hypothetical protein
MLKKEYFCPMKNIIPILSAAILLFSACSQNKPLAQSATVPADSLASTSQPLFARMKIQDSIKVGEPVTLKFTVYNTADTVQQFCKWHTPFEPLISKYLDVKDSSGLEANYRGAMAKRIMPPPADSYIKVNPGDSLSVDVDVLKGYDVQNPGKYSISYSGQNMSGLVLKDSVSFSYVKP